MKRLSRLLLLLPFALAAWLVVAITAPGRTEIDRTVARIADLRAEVAALQSRLSDLQQEPLREELAPTMLRPAKSESEATLSLQQVIVKLANQHGVKANSFGAAPSPRNLGTRAVAIILQGEGETEAVGRFLAALEGTTPQIGISQLSLRELSRRRVEGSLAPVAIRIVAWSFWSESET